MKPSIRFWVVFKDCNTCACSTILLFKRCRRPKSLYGRVWWGGVVYLLLHQRKLLCMWTWNPPGETFFFQHASSLLVVRKPVGVSQVVSFPNIDVYWTRFRHLYKWPSVGGYEFWVRTFSDQLQQRQARYMWELSSLNIFQMPLLMFCDESKVDRKYMSRILAFFRNTVPFQKRRPWR